MHIPFKLIALIFMLFLTACSIAPRPAASFAPTASKIETATLAAPTESVLSEVEVTPSPTSTASPTATNSPTPTSTPTPTFTPRSSTATPRPATPVPTPKSDGKITIGLVGELTTLNPLTNLNPTLRQVSPLLYRSPALLDPLTAKAIPDLALLPTVSADGLTLTVTLRVTAPSPADLQASIQAAVWPELADMRRVRQTGSHILTIELLQPNCALVDNLARLPVLFQGDVGADTPQTTGSFWWGETLTPSLTLPLREGEGNDSPPSREGLGEDETPSTLQLIANPDYAGDPPQLSAITVRFFDDETSAREALQAGEVDILPLRQKPQELPDGYRIETYPGSLVAFITFNNQEKPFDQAIVRQALSLAVDRAKILEIAFDGEGELAAGMTPPTHWAADPALAVPDYAPDRAANMLDKAGLRDTDGDGWRDLPDTDETWQVRIRVNRGNVGETTAALLIADALRQIGVQARAEIIPFFILIDDLTTHDYQMAVYSLPVPPDLDRRPYWHSGQIEAALGINLAAYANPQVDAWLDEINQVPNCNPAKRAALYQKVQAQLAQDRPLDFLVRPHYFVALREDIQGVTPGPFAPFTWNVGEWRLESGD